jgi:hypothetical protein
MDAREAQAESRDSTLKFYLSRKQKETGLLHRLFRSSWGKPGSSQEELTSVRLWIREEDHRRQGGGSHLRIHSII